MADLFEQYGLEGLSPPRLIDGQDVVTRGNAASWATFSTDGLYRYLLGRVWDDHGALLVVCLLNPSTADETVLDPTLRRVQKFAERDHYGGFLVTNIFAYRSTDPRGLRRVADPVGPRNDEAILAAADVPMMARVVAGWGRPANNTIKRRMGQVTRGILVRRTWHVFGPRTKDGYPRHPLYLRSDVPIVRWA
jgi:hypothetical protein